MIEPPEIRPLTTDITSGWVERKESAIVLDRVGNANNLGAIIRSAAFFGIKNIVIPLDEAQSSITTSSYRVAEGGMEYVTVYSIRSIEKLLMGMRDRMIRVGTALNAKESVSSLRTWGKDKGCLIVLGNEENGISNEVRHNCDHLVIIPYHGVRDEAGNPKIDSLNVAQASAIIMYELAGGIPQGAV